MTRKQYPNEDFYKAVHQHGAVVPSPLISTPKHVHGPNCGCSNYHFLLSHGKPSSSSPTASASRTVNATSKPNARNATNGLRSPSDILQSIKQHRFTPYQIFGQETYAQAVRQPAKSAFTSRHSGHNGRMIRDYEKARQEREAVKTASANLPPSPVSLPLQRTLPIRAPEWRPSLDAFKLHHTRGRNRQKKKSRPRSKVDLSDAWDRNFTWQSGVAPWKSRQLSLSEQRKLVRKHVYHASATWKCSLESLLEMEDAIARVWDDPVMKIIAGDPGRFYARRLNPDENRILFVKSKGEVVKMFAKLPRKHAKLVPFCAFLQRCCLQFPPAAYIWILKQWKITSVSLACKILTYGLNLYLPIRTAVCRLLLSDKYFSDWNRYTPAFLCRAMSRADLYTDISFERFSSPEFQKCLRKRDLAYFIRNTLKPDEKTLQVDFSTTFSHFATQFPQICELLNSFKSSIRKQIYSRALDGVFTKWHYELVKDIAPYPWKVYTPDMDMLPKYLVAFWKYEGKVKAELQGLASKASQKDR